MSAITIHIGKNFTNAIFDSDTLHVLCHCSIVGDLVFNGKPGVAIVDAATSIGGRVVHGVAYRAALLHADRATTIINYPGGDLCDLIATGAAHLDRHVIHGFMVDNDALWYKERGRALAMPQQKTRAAWVARLQQTPLAGKVLVGHSLGALAILRYLETTPVQIPVAHLVAPGLRPSLPMLLETGFYGAWDWSTIRSRCARFIVYWSDDDEYVKQDETAEIVAALGAELVIASGRGHYLDGAPDFLE